ncbi:hypothetical protein DM01DRAFT_1340681 [Hesseltinella vesiculosa]|uniref:Uncharacterized protein n=1 Tax=Hesseltinella vesiculosa TaxID=101127 RepID=A0A1X2G3F4_9FUNG|nr:hypothetical protein DM01DRAFT_1340681 [Hesseltinella vesiculosa]
MRMINAKPSLKMFQALSANSLADTHLWSPTSSDVSSKSGFFDTQQSFHGSKRSLQYYRSLRHDHSDFSNSMASTLATLPPPSPSASTLSTLVWHSQTSAQQDPPSH